MLFCGKQGETLIQNFQSVNVGDKGRKEVGHRDATASYIKVYCAHPQIHFYNIYRIQLQYFSEH